MQVIVEEAGGRFTDLGGVRTADGGDAIATNGLLHDRRWRSSGASSGSLSDDSPVGLADRPAWRQETLAVACGRESSPGAPLNIPPTFASTYREGGAIAYGRWGNPTWIALEEALGALEGGRAVVFASGQAATAAVLAQAKVGARVAVALGCYAGTRGLLEELGSSGRLRVTSLDVTDTQAVLAALDRTDLLWLESPTNPMLGIAELPVILAAARDAGVPTVVDNTFATPFCSGRWIGARRPWCTQPRSTSAGTRICCSAPWSHPTSSCATRSSLSGRCRARSRA